ncbi:hypothetical protein [Alkalimarinus alittae]|uniref:Uncharacterized protein n=1 Tax=Alkalimarinus alittae TaxID=2961619 RepID=A0ABY6N1G5_9ALTE|nr:hypothetical protein [Alkalimarinus alittae]UZE95852.1 hypothetical protein NKI27_17635 [Alkalimarinus alittae]
MANLKPRCREKKLLKRPIGAVVCCMCLFFVVNAEADLKPIGDSELANVVGQAYISIDKSYHPDTSNSTSYTRINLGMDIEIQSNIDYLELGRYDRVDPYGEQKPADVMIHNMSLGYIFDSNYYIQNPDAARPIKEDGSGYFDGEIVPFEITDPFIEFAYDDNSNEMTGVRIGFGEAKGVLSGNIEALTGNVDVDIRDRGEGMKNASSNGNLSDRLLVLLTPLLEGDSPIEAQAKLVDQFGNLDPIRSTMIGIPNNETFVLSGAGGFTRWSVKNLLGGFSSSEIDVPNCSFFSCPKGDIIIYVNGCKVLGVDACFNLEQFESFPIGQVEERQGSRYLTNSASGMFMSFQTKDLEWLQDVRKQNPSAKDFVKATSGAFFNIPNSSVTVNLEEALNGVPRVRTEYIDRGNGLF